MADLLNVKNLQVKVEEKEILHGVDLTVNRGETHVLMGPNGAGKSTLGNALMGNPQYQIIGGKILFNGQDITTEPTDQRAKLGMFLSFQNPLEVPGITLGNFIRSALQQRTGKHSRWTRAMRTVISMSASPAVRRKRPRSCSFSC